MKIKIADKSRLNGFRHMYISLKNSLQGIVACFKHEIAFRQECLFAVPHFLMVAFVPMEIWMRIVLCALWIVLMAVELLNTAIEAVTDLASPARHELAKKAKDCASAAVLCILVVLLLCWIVVFFQFLKR